MKFIVLTHLHQGINKIHIILPSRSVHFNISFRYVHNWLLFDTTFVTKHNVNGLVTNTVAIVTSVAIIQEPMRPHRLGGSETI